MRRDERPLARVPISIWLALAASLAAQIAWRAILRRLPEKVVSPKYAELFALGNSIHQAYLLRRALFLPNELRAFLDPELVGDGIRELDLEAAMGRSIAGVRNSHAAIAALELSWYMRSQLLRDTDWAGMAHGLEVRTPFVDVPFFEALVPGLLSPSPASA